MKGDSEIDDREKFIPNFTPSEIKDIILKRNMDTIKFNPKTTYPQKLSKLAIKSRYSRKTLLQIRETKLKYPSPPLTFP